MPSDERSTNVKTNDLVKEWRRTIGSIPGAESLTYRAEMIRTGDPINIQFNAQSLETLAENSRTGKTTPDYLSNGL